MIIPQETERHVIQYLIQTNELDSVNYAFAGHNPTRARGVYSPSGPITTDSSKTDGVSFTPFYINLCSTALWYDSLFEAQNAL